VARQARQRSPKSFYVGAVPTQRANFICSAYKLMNNTITLTAEQVTKLNDALMDTCNERYGILDIENQFGVKIKGTCISEDDYIPAAFTAKIVDGKKWVYAKLQYCV